MPEYIGGQYRATPEETTQALENIAAQKETEQAILDTQGPAAVQEFRQSMQRTRAAQTYGTPAKPRTIFSQPADTAHGADKFAGIEGPSTEDFYSRLLVMRQGNEISAEELNQRLNQRLYNDNWSVQAAGYLGQLQGQVRQGTLTPEQAQTKWGTYQGQIPYWIGNARQGLEQRMSKKYQEVAGQFEGLPLGHVFAPGEKKEQQDIQNASILGWALTGGPAEPSMIERWRLTHSTEITPKSENAALKTVQSELPGLIEQFHDPTSAMVELFRRHPELPFSVNLQTWNNTRLAIVPAAKKTALLLTKLAQRSQNGTITSAEVDILRQVEHRLHGQEKMPLLQAAAGTIYGLFGGEMVHGTLAAIQKHEKPAEIAKTFARGAARSVLAGGVGSILSLVRRNQAWASATGASEWLAPILAQHNIQMGYTGKLLADIGMDPSWFAGFMVGGEGLAMRAIGTAEKVAVKTTRGLIAAGRVSEGAEPLLTEIGRQAFVENFARQADMIFKPAVTEHVVRPVGWTEALGDTTSVFDSIHIKTPLITQAREAGIADDVIQEVVTQAARVADNVPHTGAFVLDLTPKFLPVPPRLRPYLVIGGLRAKSITGIEQLVEIQSRRLTQFKNPVVAAFNRLFRAYGNVPSEMHDALRLNEDLGRMVGQTFDAEASKMFHGMSSEETSWVTRLMQEPRNFKFEGRARNMGLFTEAVRRGENPWRTTFAHLPQAEKYAGTLDEKMLAVAKNLPEAKWDRILETAQAANEAYDGYAGGIVEHNFIREVAQKMDIGDTTTTGLYAGRPGLRGRTLKQIDGFITSTTKARDDLLAAAQRKIADMQELVEQTKMEPTPVMRQRIGSIEGQIRAMQKEVDHLRPLPEEELAALHSKASDIEDRLANVADTGTARRNIQEMTTEWKNVLSLQAQRDTEVLKDRQRWLSRGIKAAYKRLIVLDSKVRGTVTGEGARSLLNDLRRTYSQITKADVDGRSAERLRRGLVTLNSQRTLWEGIQEMRTIGGMAAKTRIEQDVMTSPLFQGRLAKAENALRGLGYQRVEALARERLMARADEIWGDEAIPWQVKPLVLRDEFHYPKPGEEPSELWKSVGEPALERFRQPYYVPQYAKEPKKPITGMFNSLWERGMRRRITPQEAPRKYQSLEALEADGYDVLLEAPKIMSRYGGSVAGKISREAMLSSLRRTMGISVDEALARGGYTGEKGGVTVQQALQRSGFAPMPDRAPNELKGLLYPQAAGEALVELVEQVPVNASQYSQMFKDISRIAQWPSKQLRVLYTAARIPDYQLRNAFSDSVQMYLGGFRNPAFYWEAARVQKLIFADRAALGREAVEMGDRWLTGEGRRIPLTKVTDRDVARQAIKFAIESGGGMERDVGFAVGNKLRWWWGLDDIGKASQLLETNRRLAFFTDGLAKGLSPTDAASRVNRSLYRFGELSQFEKTTMRGLLFFYSWYRKNLGFQMYAALAHPEQFAYIRSLSMAMKRLYPESRQIKDEDMPDYIKRFYAIPVPPEMSDKLYAAMVERGIPVAPDQEYAITLTGAIQDIGQVEGGPNAIASLLSNLNPAARIALEAAFKKKMYTGQDINALDPVHMPAYWLALPKWARRWIGADVEWPPGSGNQVGFSTQRWIRDTIHDIVGPLGMIDKFYEKFNPSGVTPVVGAQGWLDASFNYLTGMRVRTWSPSQERAKDKAEMDRLLFDPTDGLYPYMVKNGWFGEGEKWGGDSLDPNATPLRSLQQYPAPPNTEELDWRPKAAAGRLFNNTSFTVFPKYTTDGSMDIMPFFNLNDAGRMQRFYEDVASQGWQMKAIGLAGGPRDDGPARFHLEYVGKPGAQPGPPQMPGPPTRPTRPEPQIAPFVGGGGGTGTQAPTGASMWQLGAQMRQQGNTGTPGQLAVSIAKQYLGVKYVYGGTSAKGLDCSGLTQTALRQVGYDLPRTSMAQWREGREIPVDEAQPGDLIFFQWRSDGPHHVGIMDTDGYFVHAARGNGAVKREKLSTYFLRGEARARRVLP